MDDLARLKGVLEWTEHRHLDEFVTDVMRSWDCAKRVRSEDIVAEHLLFVEGLGELEFSDQLLLEIHAECRG